MTEQPPEGMMTVNIEAQFDAELDPGTGNPTIFFRIDLEKSAIDTMVVRFHSQGFYGPEVPQYLRAVADAIEQGVLQGKLQKGSDLN